MQTKMGTKDPIFKLSLNFAIIGLNKKYAKRTLMTLNKRKFCNVNVGITVKTPLSQNGYIWSKHPQMDAYFQEFGQNIPTIEIC